MFGNPHSVMKNTPYKEQSICVLPACSYSITIATYTCIQDTTTVSILYTPWHSLCSFHTPVARTMKGIEVPNPRRSSASDCTCVLTRNRSLSCDSLMLAMRIVLFHAHAKFAHEFLMLFHRPCATHLYLSS